MNIPTPAEVERLAVQKHNEHIDFEIKHMVDLFVRRMMDSPGADSHRHMTFKEEVAEAVATRFRMAGWTVRIVTSPVFGSDAHTHDIFVEKP